MSAGLSKLATALTVVFAVSLAVLIGDLLYVLWRRRRSRQRSFDPFQSYSKELLYFFCSWKNRSRIEPDAAAADPPPPPDGVCEPPLTVVVEEEEEAVVKWQQGLYAGGPCRFLFTINEEEEREDLESEKRMSSSCEDNRIKATRISDHQADNKASSVVVEIGGDDQATTPFSTPCASPPYYTPSPSPSRDER